MDDLDELLDSLINYKFCTTCKKAKLKEEFSKNKHSKDGLHYLCRECNTSKSKKWQENNKDRHNKKSKEWELNNPHKIKSSRLKSDYGITLEIYYEILSKQHGGCGICGTIDPTNDGKHIGKYFHVDHCHDTKKVRGLLCNDCNNGLSKFKDNPEFLRAAARYLEENA